MKYQLAITLKDGTLIGSFGVRIERPGVASIGCELGRRWHGKGYAREAGIRALVFAFLDLDIEQVYAETIPENRAALRLCQALGLEWIDTRPESRHFKGRSWDTAVCVANREPWLSMALDAGIFP